MEARELEDLFRSIQDGTMTPQAAAEAVLSSTTEPSGQLDLGHSRLDTDRPERCGHPEVVYGAGKSPQELVDVVRALHEAHGRVLATRVEPAGRAALQRELGDVVRSDERSATVVAGDLPDGTGDVTVVSAGTSDGAVAREAAITARFLGARTTEIPDVGVAGIHRILSQAPRIRAANAIVVVAGMEGALPSVVGGLVDKPVIAVPTSVGYGAAFGGIAALLGMLNSCASGVTVVNIDNGFGAGFAAAQINREIVRAAEAARATTP
ncbi:MAG: nickel pincer cofactor biosynthesis protein LarB [Planctomycetota bacterium]